MADGIKGTVDLTEFNKAFALYVDETSKTFQEACNNKLFDIARFALKDTFKPDAGTIRNALSEISQKNKNMTVAEMIVVAKNRKEGIQTYDLKKEARTVMNKKVGAAGYTRSGWIKPMVELLPYIGKNRLSVGGVSKNLANGGADPVKRPSNVMKGSVWNDAAGKHNNDKVVQVKEKGAQSAVDKVSSDMIDYLETKLGPLNKKFSSNN